MDANECSGMEGSMGSYTQHFFFFPAILQMPIKEPPWMAFKTFHDLTLNYLCHIPLTPSLWVF